MKFSIITVCKNPGESLKKTIESVLTQTYKDIEYIIIDGASTDGTREYLEEIAGLISKGERFFAPTKCFKFLSEPDTGIYNAMNKGISMAMGDVLYFLNAGDRLFDENVIERVVEEFEKSGADFVYTDIFCEKSEAGRSGEIKKFDSVDRYFLIRDCISHQSSFYKKRVFEKLGKFNEKYQLASDYDFLMIMMNDNEVKVSYCEVISAYYDVTGQSSINRELLVMERLAVIKSYFTFFERLYLNSFLYRFYRKSLMSLTHFFNQYRGKNG